MKREFALTYCMNVHPTETLQDVYDSLRGFAVQLKPLAAPRRSMGLGLRLGRAAVKELTADPGAVHSLRQFLDNHGFFAMTINAYPMGDFRAGRVKEEVYRPTWLDEERVTFTEEAARILAGLLPAGAVGTVSTPSGTFKPWASGRETERSILTNQVRVAATLEQLRQQSGHSIMLCLEPEPLTTLERTDEVAAYFQGLVYGEGVAQHAQLTGLSASAAEESIRRHLGLCFDTCHQAVEFEDLKASLDLLLRAGVTVGKMQLSNALELAMPISNIAGMERLQAFDEERYLHQTVGLASGGEILRAEDLKQVLSRDLEQWLPCEAWRVHFHVPVFLPSLGPLATTQAALLDALEFSILAGVTQHYELETYTWDVLPAGDRDESCGTSLLDSLRREFEWTHRQLRRLGCEVILR
ncbi:MAG: metabolite traffic protein EboE [Planctomycetes bacterium]|nr:metabolite traffic protein EboE [Planctomycetota bacterium]